MRHGQGRSHHVTDGIKFGKQNGINLIFAVIGTDGLMKHAHLVDTIVPHQGFSDKDNHVGLIFVSQFSQGLHKGDIVLHSTGGIYQDDVVLVLNGLLNGSSGDATRILGITLAVNGELQTFGVDAQLFDSATSKGITSRQEWFTTIAFEIVGQFGQTRRLSDTIDLKAITRKKGQPATEKQTKATSFHNILYTTYTHNDNDVRTFRGPRVAFGNDLS
jgi:hypothetical protein